MVAMENRKAAPLPIIRCMAWWDLLVLRFKILMANGLPVQFPVDVPSDEIKTNALKISAEIRRGEKSHSSSAFPHQDNSTGQPRLSRFDLQTISNSLQFRVTLCAGCSIKRNDYQVHSLLPEMRDVESWHDRSNGLSHNRTGTVALRLCQ